MTQAREDVRIDTTTVSSFAKMARKPGGKSRAQCLADANTAIAAMSGQALNRIRLNLEFLRERGRQCADSDDFPHAALAQAYARAVEIVEIASFLQIGKICEIATSMSELISRMQAQEVFCHESYTVHVEALRIAIASPEETSPALDDLIARLGLVVEQLSDPDAELKEQATA
ncbi:hypothetical protein [Minwuia sp.]|uniref:hypothetical protein n=1 Tax=Minwuia sp. TaxID=2493630 RepID=UPI003A8E06B8